MLSDTLIDTLGPEVLFFVLNVCPCFSTWFDLQKHLSLAPTWCKSAKQPESAEGIKQLFNSKKELEAKKSINVWADILICGRLLAAELLHMHGTNFKITLQDLRAIGKDLEMQNES